MENPTYPFRSANRDKFFTFKSEGPKGVIHKVVQFSQRNDGSYNLGLADFSVGKLDFENTSNNEDFVLIISTVVATALKFTEVYPDCEVYIRGVGKRLKVYNVIFRRTMKKLPLSLLFEGG